MDIISMAMAKKAMPTILDLTQFECVLDGTTTTYNDALVSVFYQAVMAGGALQHISFDDVGGKLSAAATGKNNLILRVTMPAATVDFPLMVASDEEHGVTQLAFIGLMAVPGTGIIDLKAYLQFNGDSAEIGVTATIVGA